MPLAILLAVSFAMAPSSASAHGFGARYNLPIPLEFYLGGAGIIVAVSFLIFSSYSRTREAPPSYPRVNLWQWSIGRKVLGPFVVFPMKFGAVFLLGAVVATGFLGTQNPQENITPTFIWIIWWVGVAFVSALIGNLWRIINPWAAVFEGIEILYCLIRGKTSLSLNWAYPRSLGIWPAFLLFSAFAWIELVFTGATVPMNLATMVAWYSLMTWLGMFLFGKRVWLQQGEPFSLVFGILANFSPTEIRIIDKTTCKACVNSCLDDYGQCINCYDCLQASPPESSELNLRPFAIGLMQGNNSGIRLLPIVILMLTTVTFDGFVETTAWASIESTLYALLPNTDARLTVASTVGFLGFVSLSFGIYLFFVYITRKLTGNRFKLLELASASCLSLIPIGLAYHLAHYLPLFLIDGQNLIRLASDPFGYGWNLFGTTSYRINIGIIDAQLAWVATIVFVVTGHIISVYLSHLTALRLFRHHNSVVRSQYPMVILMVIYTMLSLWILAQPVVSL